MSDTQIKRQRQATNAQLAWDILNPTLKEGDLLFESDSGQVKIGGSANWQGSDYFSLGDLSIMRLTGDAIIWSGAFLCGKLIIASSPAATLSISMITGDKNSGFPKSSFYHFPEGGFFYYFIEDGGPSPTLLTVKSGGPEILVRVQEFGTSVEMPQNSSHLLNNGESVQGKLYRFDHLGGNPAIWVVTEQDKKEVWAQAKTLSPLTIDPSYLSVHVINGVILSPDALFHVLEFDTISTANNGGIIDYPSNTFNRLLVVSAGDYKIRAGIIFDQALTNPFISVFVNGAETLLKNAYENHQDQSPTSSAILSTDGILTLAKDDIVYIGIRVGVSTSPSIQTAQLVFEKLDA